MVKDWNSAELYEEPTILDEENINFIAILYLIEISVGRREDWEKGVAGNCGRTSQQLWN